LSADPNQLSKKLFDIYQQASHDAYLNGTSANFSCMSLDFMINCGAKGKPSHKDRFRDFIHGIYNDDEYKASLIDTRNSMISKTLRTGESGHINRQLCYLLDDVYADGTKIYDMQKFVISFKVHHLPVKLQNNDKIGLYCVTAIIPELTQSVLDSSHTTSAGESYVNIVPELKKVLSCTHKKGLETFKLKGIEEYHYWLIDYLYEKLFQQKISRCWFELLADFICQTGEPMGISLTESSMLKRYNVYYEGTKERPILKMAKYGNPIRVFKMATANRYTDSLFSSHSRMLFR